MEPSKNKLALLTLNAHSLMEEDDNACMDAIVDLMIREDVAAAAFQEVNQLGTEEPVDAAVLDAAGYVSCGDSCPVRKGNFVLQLAQKMRARGENCAFTWIFAHTGYGLFEEGVSFLTRVPILETCTDNISRPDVSGDHTNRRKLLGVRCKVASGPVWLWCVHLGWWSDVTDPFPEQWARLSSCIHSKEGTTYLMGDFNAPADCRAEGYDLVCSSGWEDCYMRAEKKGDGFTVGGQIDGWRSDSSRPLRIDYAFARQPGRTLESRVVFDGKREMVVSDHFGLLTIEA